MASSSPMAHRALIALLLISLLTHQATARKNLILDTDIFSDCDDAAAIQLAATSPAVKLLAINLNTNSSYSALATSAILAHYNRNDVPIGISHPLDHDTTFFDKQTHSLGEFASKVAHHWSPGQEEQPPLKWSERAEDAWDPVELYRSTLAACEDGSVTIASLGFLGNLAGLLDSPADGYSELTGEELISAKVSELVIMGGEYPSGREWNFWGAGSAWASAHVVNDWPGRMVFSGFELGAQVYSGGRLMSDGPLTDPVRAAYIYYTYGHVTRSWDPVTVLYAIRGLSDIFEYGNQNGYNRVDKDGSNAWVEDKRVRNQHWLKLKLDNDTVGDMLDQLYLEAAWMAEDPRAGQEVPRPYRLPRFPKTDLFPKAEL